MSRKQSSHGLRWIVVFVLVVVLTGFALAATGHFENPFSVVTMFTQSAGSAGGQPQPRANNNTSDQNMPQRDGGGEGGQASISWSQIGGVLYNVWFLGTMTAVVIVFQKQGGLLIAAVRKLRPIPPAGKAPGLA